MKCADVSDSDVVSERAKAREKTVSERVLRGG